MLQPRLFFDLSAFAHAALFDDLAFVWQALPAIGAYARAQLATAYQPALLGTVATGAYLVNPELIYLGEGSIIEPGAYVAGPCIIGRHCEIRHGAYVRGDVILGDDSIIGHASEVKNSIFLNGAHAPHFAYVGDSILGNRVNLGAGTKLSQVISDNTFLFFDEPSGQPLRNDRRSNRPGQDGRDHGRRCADRL